MPHARPRRWGRTVRGQGHAEKVACSQARQRLDGELVIPYCLEGLVLAFLTARLEPGNEHQLKSLLGRHTRSERHEEASGSVGTTQE